MAVQIVAANGAVLSAGSDAIVKNTSGRMWFALPVGTTTTFYYSDDAGDTWSAATGTLTQFSNGQGALATDVDGNLHYSALNSGNTATLYWFGTVSGTTITWSSPLTINSAANVQPITITAFAYGTGWKAFVMTNITPTNAIKQITIDSGGTPTLTTQYSTALAPQWGNLDFIHTGDGVTAAGDPHVLLCYTNSVNTRFIKLVHSSGTWTANAERTISSATYSRVHGCYNGTDYAIMGDNGSGTFALWLRDVADTTTTSRASASGSGSGWCRMTYDGTGDLYVGYIDSNQDPAYQKWTRSSNTWGGAVIIEADSVTNANTTFDRGAIGGFRGFYWVRQTPNPDQYMWELILDFTSPPTWLTPENNSAQRRELELTLDWEFNDPDSGSSQTAWRIKRVVNATDTTYWNGTDWQASEDGSTKISGTTTQFTLSQNWATAEDTIHDYYVKTWDNTNAQSGYSNALSIYPISIAATNKGLALPRPWKRQSDLIATLKSNNDYLLSWVNNYLPSYGNANQDLTVRAGLRTSSQSLMRDVFPPVIGAYSVGNGTSYFENIGATNVYRTNEIALSSRAFKNFREHHLPVALDFVNKIPVTTWEYKDKKRMGDAKERFGFTAEDFLEPIHALGITPKDSAILFNEGKDEDGNVIWYLNQEQLVPILWQAVQELAAAVKTLRAAGPPG